MQIDVFCAKKFKDKQITSSFNAQRLRYLGIVLFPFGVPCVIHLSVRDTLLSWNGFPIAREQQRVRNGGECFLYMFMLICLVGVSFASFNILSDLQKKKKQLSTSLPMFRLECSLLRRVLKSMYKAIT